GAHTMTHPHLLTLSDEEARLEIVNSKLLLESIIGAPVTSFAYPFGESSPAIQSFVAYGGFNVAVDADSRYGNNYRNIFQIPRTGISEKTSLSSFIRAVHGW
ncbi:MAG: polysaccharide deacetylase family protein, partial [Candidatus Magasanikbacteria bacterium]|nr:polysaccharide deacetylase family protein [Candidatus Magasanikbacteria bacterium]